MISDLSHAGYASPAHRAHRLPAWVVGAGIVVAAATVLLALALSGAGYRRPLDPVALLRSSVYFAGVLAAALWVRHDVKTLNWGLASLLLSLWMVLVGGLTAPSPWQAAWLEAGLATLGLGLIVLGVREVARRRSHESGRRADADAELRRSLVTLRAVVESTPDAIWVKGSDGRFLMANTAFADLVGRPESAIVGRSESELFADHPDDRGRLAWRSLAGDAAERFEATVTDIGAVRRTFLVSRNAIRDADGQAIGTLGVGRDISERKATEDRLLQLVAHDALTGLPTRDAFRERLGRSVSRWRHRPDRPFAVLFLDIDRFKEVNDTFGHAAGDELLVAFGAALGRWLRPGDFVGRYGGDEFTVLLPEVASLADAETVARRVLAGLAAPFALSVGPVVVSASIGIAAIASAADSAESLLRAADAAMYRAKAQGRGRLVSA